MRAEVACLFSVVLRPLLAYMQFNACEEGSSSSYLIVDVGESVLARGRRTTARCGCSCHQCRYRMSSSGRLS
jgi:hypothetical protein